MQVLPLAFQPFLTWLTGKPLPEQQPLFVWSSVGRAIWTLAVLVFGLALGALGLAMASWYSVPLLLLSWMLTTGAMRLFYVVIEHVCTHGIFSRRVAANRVMGEVISTLLWATPFEIFRKDHRIHHSSTRLQVDPDVQFILGTGFTTDMSAREFWRYLFITLVSPRFHLSYFAGRLKLNFTGRPYRVAMSVCYAAAKLAFLSVTGLWLEWALLWFFPASVLFQISSLINYHSEHRWPSGEKLDRKEKARLSFARFCGDPVPEGDILGWLIWWLRVFFVHLPYRLFVLVGDLPQHDLHHRRPGSDWANAAYVRRDDTRAGHGKWSAGYSEVWGSMIDHLRASIEHTDRKVEAVFETATGKTVGLSAATLTQLPLRKPASERDG